MIVMTKRIHDQRPSRRFMICTSCRVDRCESCVDRLRSVYTTEMICECTRRLHTEKRDGEPTLQQIEDPLTGTIHAPDLTISIDGEVKFRDGFNPFNSDD